MNSTLNNNHNKIIGALVSMALLSVIVYIAALFNIPRTHAAEPMLFPNVEIQDGSMQPLALSVAPALNATVQTSANTNSQTNVGANTNVSATVSPSASAGSAMSQDATVQNSTDATMPAPTNISTTDDLNLYTKSLQENDRDISNIDVNNDHVIVAYREPAKFLGFIPVSVTANAQVDAEGNVTLHYPWYTFLSSKNDEQLKADLQTRVAEVMGAQGGMNAGMTASSSPQSRAELIQALHTALKGGAEANAQANTTATANSQY